MNYLVWTPDLNVGIPEIDEEHMRWIAYINALHAGIEAGQEQEILESLLDDVIAFAQEHFMHEEALFEGTGYPDALQHKKLHSDYLLELATLKQRLMSEKADTLTYDVMLSLKKWLINHVQEADFNYVTYIQQKTIIK